MCAGLTDERADQLQLPSMVPDNSESQRTAFTVTVDLRHGTTTGISAADRSAAIRALAQPDSVTSSPYTQRIRRSVSALRQAEAAR